MHKLRRALVAASILILIGGLGWSAANFVDGLTAINDTTSMRRQAVFYTTRYESARARLPQTPAETHVMRNVVEAVGSLKLYKTSPATMAAVLSLGLETFPQVQLDEFNWQFRQAGNAAAGGSVAPAAAAATPGGLNFRQEAIIKARISPFDGDYRQALDIVRRFAERLRQITGVEEVRVESLPLDIGPAASLSGNTEAVGDNARAEFSLSIVLRGKRKDDESS